MATPVTPTWLNRKEYPFTSNFFVTPFGKMHYVDEGAGDPVVLVHGNPSWSFMYRNLILGLCHNNRCIAPDHLGFGLSEKPRDWSYLPRDHAKNLADLLDSLDLDNITLVVGDWGGPIGLSYALHYPEKIRNIVLTNTWLWSVKNDWYYQAFSKFVGGSIGKFLIRKRNFFARDIVKAAFGDKKKLTQDIHNHFLLPLENPEERKGSWVFPRQIIGSSDWLESLWNERNKLKDKNFLIAWGMKDIAFREKELNRWIGAFPGAAVVRYAESGHYVPEEEAVDLAIRIEKLLAGNSEK
jgi:haloalkane dehalogenase